MTTTTVDRFLEAFRGRAANCRALLDLSLQQQTLIEVDDYSGLIELLNHKQQLLNELTPSEDGTTRLWESWRAEKNRLMDHDRQACERVLDETDQLLRQLMALEQTCTQLLSTRRDATRVALAEVNQGGIAVQGYLSPAEVTVSRRLDLDL